MMRRLALLALLALLPVAACEAPDSQLRLVSLESPQAAGISLRELPPATLKSLGLHYGLVVVKAGGLARLSGLRIGDIVYAVNQKRIAKFEDFSQLVAGRTDDRLGLLVRRGTSDFYVSIDLSGERQPRDTLLRT